MLAGDPDYALGLPGIDFMMHLEDEDVPGNVFWVKFGSRGYRYDALDPVEGKLYLPQNPNGELIHFSPGFPGGNAGRFERLHARAFVEAGYGFSTHRFNGTSLSGPDAEEVINAPERLEDARRNNERHLGGTITRGRRIVDVVWHPAAVLSVLHPAFEKIHTIGHSMGVAANNISVNLLDHHPVYDKMGSMISLAGYLGGMSEEKDVWNGLAMSMAELAEYELTRFLEKDVNFTVDEQEYRGSMKAIAGLNEIVRLPPQVGQVLMFATNDPLIRCPNKGEDVGPRGAKKIIIRDERGVNDPKPHSMLWVTSEELLDMVRCEVAKEDSPDYRALR